MMKSHSDLAGALVEERERKLAEERLQTAQKLQRKQRLQAVVLKRQNNFRYLQKVHQGTCFWFNTVLLTRADIHAYVNSVVTKQRIESFFALGLSISKILKLASGIPVACAFSQLMEEWEYVHSGSTMQSVKLMMAKSSPCVIPQSNHQEKSSQDIIADLQRPSVHKFLNYVVFEHLHVPHIPFELDYVEVFSCLCIELSKLYEKLMEVECYSNPIVYDAIVRLDTRIKHHIINLVAKELTAISSRKVKSSTSRLRAMAGILFPSLLPLPEDT
eukprot:CAMPEP_0173276808 /NCGR_PEP_ID=MMETSP1143-20121109/3725_1 /TAXON_ID=483371 /ORGANISM="non described non described, Strain CCMP2298" /LENGTH=272 /DNA_ID=CAMNT_0014213819 /DNA_START=109 /DNA_END=924 /DNA_ORIENTATION=+